jgi:excinuclease ABC subunit A
MPKRNAATSNPSRPYARRLFHQMAVPEVDEIERLPPAVALQQQRGSPTTRSSAGSVTTLSSL